VLVLSYLTLLVFGGAHVYAGTIANHGVRDGKLITLGAAFNDAIHHTSGMLYAAVLPSVPLIVAVFGGLKDDDAASISMLVVVVQLAIIGYDSFTQRRSPIVIRILGAIGTGLFGFVMVILNLLVH
jgi:predicted anti-sigma-YlaC factor YlaD